MLINWFTVIAQVVNFLTLVWLLKRFLYKPVLKAIDDREKKITSRIEDAEKKDADAIKKKKEFQKKNESFDKERKDLLRKATEESSAEKLLLLEEVRKEAIALREKMKAALKDDQENIGDEIARKTKKEVFAIARKTLRDLANVDLESQIVKVFVKRLQHLEKKKGNALITAFESSDKPVMVRSAFVLTSVQHTAIKKALEAALGHTSKFQFETTPEPISGIELIAGGYKVAWSITEYFASVEKAIDEIIQTKTKSSNAEKSKTADKAEAKNVAA